LIEVMHRNAQDGVEEACARSVPPNTGDFQLMSRCVIELLRYLRESHGFLPGFVAVVGFKQAYVEYAQAARFSRKGKHNRLFGSVIGLNRAIGFSNRPLTLWLMDGPAIAGLSFASAIVMAFLKLSSSLNYPMRFPRVTVLVLFTGYAQLISAIFLGEGIGRIYDEGKLRTTHVIMKRAT
jgi:hypothetical protein